MMLWLVAGIACLTVLLVLWWSWRRQPGSVSASAAGLLVIAIMAGFGGWLLLGKHPETPRWLASYQEYHGLARGLIDGQPDMEALSEVPAGVMATVLQRELQRDGSAEGWYGLSLIYEQLEAPQLAEESARTAVRHAGDAEPAPKMLLARTLLAQGDNESLEEARDILEQLLADIPQHDGARAMLGVVSARLGDYDTAIAAWETMLEKHPDGQAADAIRLALEDIRSRKAGADRYGKVTVTVFAPEEVAPGGTLFVFLRQADSPGGQPLAAKRVLADRWPLTVEVGPQDWLQDFPAEDTPLVAGARYAQAPGGAVTDAGLEAAPESLAGEPGSLSAELRLQPAP